jgi:hypothetical protein
MLGPEEIEVPDVGVLVFRGTDGRSLGARLDKIGEAKSEIAAAQPRTEEPTARHCGEKRFQRLLQIRPHPVGKILSRNDQVLQPDRREMRRKQAEQRKISLCTIHLLDQIKKNGEKPAIGKPSTFSFVFRARKNARAALEQTRGGPTAPKHEAQMDRTRPAEPARRNPVSGRLGAPHWQRTKPTPRRAYLRAATVMSCHGRFAFHPQV